MARTRDRWNACALLEGVHDGGKRDGGPSKIKDLLCRPAIPLLGIHPKKQKLEVEWVRAQPRPHSALDNGQKVEGNNPRSVGRGTGQRRRQANSSQSCNRKGVLTFATM